MNKVIPLKLLIIAGLGFFSQVWAQTSEMDAKQQLRDQLNQLKTFQADFTQTVVDFDNTVLQQAQGKIALKQPNKLYWQMLIPNESVLLADGQTLWNVDPFLEQVVAYTQEAAIENNPLILLTDPNSDKWQSFNVEFDSQQFVITPTVSGGTIEKLRLVFKDNSLVELETQDAQQQSSTLFFANIQQNQPISDVKFTFVLPPGFELDDQRIP
jgi:outer membrane lipoprotein carrier protein